MIIAFVILGILFVVLALIFISKAGLNYIMLDIIDKSFDIRSLIESLKDTKFEGAVKPEYAGELKKVSHEAITERYREHIKWMILTGVISVVFFLIAFLLKGGN